MNIQSPRNNSTDNRLKVKGWKRNTMQTLIKRKVLWLSHINISQNRFPNKKYYQRY